MPKIMMKESELRKMIREEYERVTPTPPGALMTEARAQQLADEILDEGILDTLTTKVKAAGAGVVSGVKAAVAPATKAIGTFTQAAKQAAGELASDIKTFKDSVTQKAAAAAAESLKNSVRASVTNAVKEAMKTLPASMGDDNAKKQFIRKALAAALAEIM